MVVDKLQRIAVVIDAASPHNSNTEKKGKEKPEKYQDLKEEEEKTWRVKASVAPVGTGALGAAGRI